MELSPLCVFHLAGAELNVVSVMSNADEIVVCSSDVTRLTEELHLSDLARYCTVEFTTKVHV